MSARRRHVTAALLLTVLIGGLYAKSLGHGFVSDDQVQIVKNTMIKDFRLLPMLVTTAYFSGASEPNYRPLVTLTYFVDYHLWGLNPVGFHLTNLLLHLLTTLLVYALFTRLLARWDGASVEAPSLVGAALFAVHPVLTEAASWIAARTASLSAALLLLALVWLLQWTRGRPWPLVAGLGAYALALLAKESAVVLVLLLPLTDWAGGRLDRTRRPLYAAVALLTAGYVVMRLGVMVPPGLVPSPPLVERLLVWPYATWLHLRLLVLPLHLSAHYVFGSPQSATEPMVLFPIAVLVALVLGLLWLWRRGERLACAGLAWIFIALGPVSNLIPFQPVGFQPVAERYLYLPAVGWALLLTLALGRLRARALGLGLAGLLLLTYGALTLARTPVWRDNFSLWRDTAEKMPGSPWAHNDLGAGYEARGDLSEALRQYVFAASILEAGHVHSIPRYATPFHNIGRIYLKQGRLELAAHSLRRALRLHPHHGLAVVHLGLVYQRQGRLDRAIALYRAALVEHPEESEVWANLGTALAATGRRAQALSALETARDLNPGEAVIHHNLGTLYAEEGRLPEAVAAYQTALRLNPALAGAHENLSRLYAREGRHAEAAAELAAARRKMKPARDRHGP